MLGRLRQTKVDLKFVWSRVELRGRALNLCHAEWVARQIMEAYRVGSAARLHWKDFTQCSALKDLLEPYCTEKTSALAQFIALQCSAIFSTERSKWTPTALKECDQLYKAPKVFLHLNCTEKTTCMHEALSLGTPVAMCPRATTI